MKFFDVGQEANGFIAIGQMATGFFAFGQLATGVIAIGQVSRGFIAVGMLAYGVFTLSMLGVGVGALGSMLGLGGVSLGGGVLPLVPTPRPKPKYPETTSLSRLRAKNEKGWVPVRIRTTQDGQVRLEHEGSALRVEIVRGLLGSARQAGTGEGKEALAHLVAQGDGTYHCGTLMQRLDGARPAFGIPFTLLRLILLAGLAAVFWPLVAMPIVEALFAGG